MIAIKTTMEYMPSDCDYCRWFGTRPHPYKGWTDICELMGHCMDDDQPEEWIYSGDGRPKMCPLVEIADRKTEPTISKMEQVDKDIDVRSKDEPQTGEIMTEEEFDSMLARVLTGNAEPQTDVYDYKGNGKWERSE